MKLYSYVLTYDTGFAPNPFWGYCTLACCKPVIRRTAKKKDWVIGISRKKYGNKLIYAMEVTEDPISYSTYYKRFKSKVPNFNKKQLIYKCGDNIYQPLETGLYKQLQSMHSKKQNIEEDESNKEHDLSGKFVLISSNFYYFGSDSKDIINQNKKLEPLRVGRAHKCNFEEETIEEFLKTIKSFPNGVNASPTIWNPQDISWEKIL